MTDQRQGELLKLAFDSIPSFIFVVDGDMRILEYNSAASSLFPPGMTTIFRSRSGDVLYCLHSKDVPEGCGRGPSCKDCIILKSVKEALGGKPVTRRRAKLQLVRDGETLEIYALITTSRFLMEGASLVVLVIEDINEIVELQHIIPICAACKKIRNDKNYWMRVEAYFKDHLDVDFSHTLCPDCYKVQMENLEK